MASTDPPLGAGSIVISSPASGPDRVLECVGLTKRFGNAIGVAGVSLSFGRGRIEAVIGPNGAGKTTLFHLLTGVIRADEGSVRWGEKRIDGWSPHRIARAGIGRLFQDVRPFGSLTVAENVMASACAPWTEGALAALLWPGTVLRLEADLRREADRWLDLVGLKGFAEQPARDLSFGQQKLLAIARLLAGRAEVLLLDEPTAGLNPMAIAELKRLLHRVASEGRTVVIIEHNMSFVVEMAQWIYFMDDGQVVAFGQPDEVLGDPAVRAMYIGL